MAKPQWRVVVLEEPSSYTEVSVVHENHSNSNSFGWADENKLIVEGTDSIARFEIANIICKALNKTLCPNTCKYCKRGEDCKDYT